MSAHPYTLEDGFTTIAFSKHIQSGMPGLPFRVACSGAACLLKFDAELDATQISALDAQVASFSKADADAAAAVIANALKEDAIKASIESDPLDGLAVSAVVSGLSVTVNVNSLVVDDVTTITADANDEKFLMICYVFDDQADTLTIKAYTKTTGMYAPLETDEHLARCLGEWSVPANGTQLTAV